MQRIDLETLKLYLRYDPDSGVFKWRVSAGTRRAGAEAKHVSTKGYIRIRLQGRLYEAHRLAWFYVYGEWPKGCIDHINGNRVDNRICNLRDTSRAENARNRYAPRANAPYLGVYKDRTKWRFSISRPDGVRLTKGGFLTPEDARDAYLEMKQTVHKETMDARKTSK